MLDILMNILFLNKYFLLKFQINQNKTIPGISRRRSFRNRLLVCKRIKRRISIDHVLNSVFPVCINSAIYFPTPPASAIPCELVPDATK